MPQNRTATLLRRTSTPALILSCQRRRSRRRQIDTAALQTRLIHLIASETEDPDIRAGIYAALECALKIAG